MPNQSIEIGGPAGDEEMALGAKRGITANLRLKFQRRLPGRFEQKKSQAEVVMKVKRLRTTFQDYFRIDASWILPELRRECFQVVRIEISFVIGRVRQA